MVEQNRLVEFDSALPLIRPAVLPARRRTPTGMGGRVNQITTRSFPMPYSTRRRRLIRRLLPPDQQPDARQGAGEHHARCESRETQHAIVAALPRLRDELNFTGMQRIAPFQTTISKTAKE